MPSKRTDLSAGGAGVEPLGGQRRAPQLRTRARGTAPGPGQRSAHARPDGVAIGTATARRPPPDTDPPCRAGRSTVTEIGPSGCAALVGPWEAIRARALAPDEEFPRGPIQIIPGAGRHFTSPSAQPGQPEQPRGLAWPWWGRPLTARQQVRDVLGLPTRGPG